MDASTWNGYIQQYCNEIKRHLEELKDITDIEELCRKAQGYFSAHSNNLGTMYSCYHNNKLQQKGASGSELIRYQTLVNELKELETQAFQKISTSQCQFCQKKNLVNPYIYQDIVLSKGFCDNNCFVQWKEKWSKPTNTDNQPSPQRKYGCQECQTVFAGQYWHITGEPKLTNHKFCSQQCSDKCISNWNREREREREQNYNLNSTFDSKEDLENLIKKSENLHILDDYFNKLIEEFKKEPLVAPSEIGIAGNLTELLKNKQTLGKLDDFVQGKLKEIEKIRQRKLTNDNSSIEENKNDNSFAYSVMFFGVIVIIVFVSRFIYKYIKKKNS